MSHIAITASGGAKAGTATPAFSGPAKVTFRRWMTLGGLFLLVTLIAGCGGGKVAVNNEPPPPTPTPAPNFAGVWLEKDVTETSPISKCEVQQTPNFFIVNLWTRNRGAASDTALGTFRGATRPDGTAEAEGTFSQQEGAQSRYLKIGFRSLSADEILIHLTFYEDKNPGGPPSFEVDQLLKR
jgi:hypothetical protein